MQASLSFQPCSYRLARIDLAAVTTPSIGARTITMASATSASSKACFSSGRVGVHDIGASNFSVGCAI
jgi:hypothetical protein